MHFFQCGVVFSNDEIELKGKILVADVFESNIDLSAIMVFDSDNYSDVDLMDKISDCNKLKCSTIAMGTQFDCKFDNIEVEADYCNGSIVRVYVHIKDYENHEIIPESQELRKARLDILDDLEYPDF